MDWPSDGGEMGERIRAFDWASTPIGRPERWSQSLRTAVELMLASLQPVYIAWGPELTSLHNDGYIPILGDKHPSALGARFEDLWTEVWDEYRPVVQATMAGKAQHFIDRCVALGGRPGLALSCFTFSWTPLRDETGEVAGFYCAATETTERESARRSNELRYRTLFDAIDEGFCILDMKFDDTGQPVDYRFVEVNAAFEQQTGLHHAAGRWMRELAPGHEQRWFDIYGAVASTGEPIRFVEHAKALGRWFNVYAFRLDDPRRYVGVLFADVTERRRAEDALRDADRRKDEFLATLAHELRNPLAPLRNGLQIARLTSREDDTLRRTVDMMDRQLSHLVRLVDDLMDVGRISSGKLQLRREPLMLNRVLAASVESTRVMIEARQQELVVDAGDESIQMLGDFDRLAQVFTNLLFNAAKYTPPGGTIRVSQSREGDRVRVDVVDTGIGIPAGELPRVFDLFSQVRAHQGLTGGGLGIGLALVKSIVGLHDGEVEARSEGAGLGSCFTVRLPLIAGGEPTAPADQERRRVASVARRILVADDNEDTAASLAQLLRLSGHQVWTANDGEKALEAAERLRPDTVFLDLGMPRLDGLETAARIRAQPWGASILLIALTGWGQESDRQRTVAAGFDRHLVKPPDAMALEDALERRDGADAALTTAAASSHGAGERRGSLR